MLYRYSVVLDVNPNVDKYEEIKNKLDQSALEFNPKLSSLEEMGIKEQLKFYINKHLPYNTDRVRMIALVDKL
jgi:hypothetical protein